VSTYDAVLVLIDLLHQLLDGLVGQGELLSLQALLQLLQGDVPVRVLVIVGEGRLQVVLLQIVVTLQTARYKLCIVYEPIAIRVHYVHKVDAIFLSHGTPRYLLYSDLKFLYRELAVTILIELGECLAEVLNLVLWYSRRDQSQRCALEVLRFYVVAHVLDNIDGNGELFFLLLALSLYPRVIKGFLRGASNVSLPLQEFANQVLRLVTDLLPHT
jgi:hypothetical protein